MDDQPYLLLDAEYVNQTEKAFLIAAVTVEGEVLKIWLPKSMTEVRDEKVFCSQYFIDEIKEPELGESLLKTIG